MAHMTLTAAMMLRFTPEVRWFIKFLSISYDMCICAW